MVWSALGHDGKEGIEVTHEDNEWGIELSTDDTGGGTDAGVSPSGVVVEVGQPKASNTTTETLNDGIEYKFEQTHESVDESELVKTPDNSLDDLAAQLKAMQGS